MVKELKGGVHYCFLCTLFPFLRPWSNVMCVQLRLCYLLISTTKDIKEIGTPAGLVASSGRNLDQGRYCVGVTVLSRYARCLQAPLAPMLLSHRFWGHWGVEEPLSVACHQSLQPDLVPGALRVARSF